MSVVIGLGFGDEGKGLATSFLVSQKKRPLVVRFNGGHQAGHTVVYEGQRHVFSSFGSGSLQGAPTYWSYECPIYPLAFLNEYNKIHPTPTIYVDPLSPVVTPWDVESNQRMEKGLQHGSVGVGFGATIQRQQDNYKLFAQDLFHPVVFNQKLRQIRSYYFNIWGKEETVYFDIDKYFQAVEFIKQAIVIQDYSIVNKYDCIFEGAQGIMLDQSFGFFPNVTRSNTTSRNVFDFHTANEVYYVTRTYQTRHGNGFMTNEGKELNLVNNENETNVTAEYQGKFRTRILDIDLLNYALDCDHHYSYDLKKNLIITCVDQTGENFPVSKNGKIKFIDVDELPKMLNKTFNSVYMSNGPSLENISLLKTLYA